MEYAIVFTLGVLIGRLWITWQQINVVRRRRRAAIAAKWGKA